MAAPVPSRPKAVVLLSGGLDSATCLAIAARDGFECHALTVAYGQRHAVEVAAAGRVASALKAASHKVIHIDLRAFGGSALTDDIAVPKSDQPWQSQDHPHTPGAGDDIPVTYVPARNTIFLSYALGLAEVLHAAAIYVGVNDVDYSGYPDCRPEFIHAFQHLADLATKAGVECRGPKIVAPLLELTKPQIIRRGMALGVDYAMTHSCYDPSPEGKPCARCDSCRIRAAAFAALGIPDPAIG